MTVEGVEGWEPSKWLQNESGQDGITLVTSRGWAIIDKNKKMEGVIKQFVTIRVSGKDSLDNDWHCLTYNISPGKTCDKH